MPDKLDVLAMLYGAGVLVGLARTDAAPATRLLLSALWPIGPLAFAATLLILIAASLIAFPWLGAAVLAAVLAYSVFSV